MTPELLSRYEKAREGAVKEFGLLRSEDLARAIHSTAGNVSLVASKWRRKGEIFAVNYGGKPGYFAFQFDPMTGRPKPVIAKIIQAFPHQHRRLAVGVVVDIRKSETGEPPASGCARSKS